MNKSDYIKYIKSMLDNCIIPEETLKMAYYILQKGAARCN